MHCSILVYQFQHLDSFDLTTACFAVMWSNRSVGPSEDYAKPATWLMERPDHNSAPYSF